MKLDFSKLTRPVQKQRGQGGTTGTSSIHAGSSRPHTIGNGGDTWGQTPSATFDDMKMSPMSPYGDIVGGHLKPAWILTVPVVPNVPTKKGMNRNDGDMEVDALTPTEAQLFDTLALFRFDLMAQGIAEGNPATQLHRVNNITWRLMTVNGVTFDEAIKAAAEWVIGNEQHQDEAAFVDVLALYNELNRKSAPS